MITSRRSFITGLGAALITAPAIVRPESLMKIKPIIGYYAWEGDTHIPIHPSLYAQLDFEMKKHLRMVRLQRFFVAQEFIHYDPR